MMRHLQLTRPALTVSLLALAAACGGGSSASNQSTATTNMPANQPAASAEMMEPLNNGAAETLPNAATPAEAPAAPAAPAKEKSRNTPAPASREPSAAPKAAPTPRSTPRNQAATRPPPAPPPAPADKGDCTPEHRAMGHC